MEYHLGHDANNKKQERQTLEFLQTIKDLHFKGNYRLFNWEANSCWKGYKNRNAYLPLAEIVLKKIKPDASCSD